MLDITAFSSTSVECTNTLVKIVNKIDNTKLEKYIYRLLSNFHNRLIALSSVDREYRTYYAKLMLDDISHKIRLNDLDIEYNIEIESYLLCTITAVYNKDKIKYIRQ